MDIFSLKLRTFIFVRIFFKLKTQNYTNKVFLVPKLKLFVLNDLPFHKFDSSNIRIPNISFVSKV